MILDLKKPLAFIDLETTGVNLTTDKIVEIAMIRIGTDGSRTVKRKLINPGMPIPPSSTEVHGITDEMVKDAPTFKAVANEVRQFLDHCDIGGYNSNRFDVPLLVEEFLRAGQDFDMTDRELVDVQRIYHLMEPRNLSAAYRFYCSKELHDAHSAEADAQATWEILEAQVQKYPHLGNSVTDILKVIGREEIVDFARRFCIENDTIVFNFGKHKGKPVMKVLKDEPHYYDWMMKGDFPLHTKMKLTEIFNKMMLKKI